VRLAGGVWEVMGVVVVVVIAAATVICLVTGAANWVRVVRDAVRWVEEYGRNRISAEDARSLPHTRGAR